MDENPFPGLDITLGDFLDEQTERGSCPKCSKSRKYYCYTCFVPLKQFEGRVPTVQLPVQIDVIKHASEVEGKSTAAHAAVVAPDHVRVYTYPVIPDFPHPDKVIMVYPGKDALTLQELKEKMKGKNNDKEATENGNETSEPSAKRVKVCTAGHQPFQRVIFIDSTWKQSKKIYHDERLQGLQQVGISEQETKFWRHQQGQPDTYLATIEAIYHFCREYHQLFLPSPYHGQYDDLLFFFMYQYNKIKVYHHGGQNLKAYKGKKGQAKTDLGDCVGTDAQDTDEQCATRIPNATDDMVQTGSSQTNDSHHGLDHR